MMRFPTQRLEMIELLKTDRLDLLTDRSIDDFSLFFPTMSNGDNDYNGD